MASLSPGSRLASYEILALAGAGGMGEVYRARDPKLGRELALKILPGPYALSPERLSRFQREARVLAALNHPNIATVYGLEEASGLQFFAMELVEGLTLAQRIAQGPIAIEEALPIFKELAEALEAAHAKGIVHRDLKPANVKLTAGGSVKVLDFGLAKTLQESSPEGELDSPTLTRDTRAGLVMGTPAYMSPEQARGKPVDERTDIWAFGCCLYEALTGRRPFLGETSSDVTSAILRSDPDWSALASETPEAIRRLLRRSLQKEPERRLQAIGDARIEIEEARGLDASQVPGTRRKTRPLAWLGATALILLIGAAAGERYRRLQTPASERLPVVRLSLTLPPEIRPLAPMVVSPDGRRVVVPVSDESGQQFLWLRALDQPQGGRLAGTEGAVALTALFWDPDGQHLGFVTSGLKLKKIPVVGGPAQDLGSGTAYGGTWNRGGVILLGKGEGPLRRLSAAGGDQSPATALDTTRREVAHRYPDFLPDGRHFLYQAVSDKGETALFLASLDASGGRKLLDDVLSAAYVPPGFLVYGKGSALLARRFDLAQLRISGEPILIADQVAQRPESGFAAFSASANGVLTYGDPSLLPLAQLVWFDRSGRRLGPVAEKARYGWPALSGDGLRLAIERSDPETGGDLFVLDLARGTTVRLTSGADRDANPAWSPDGKWIAFTKPGGNSKGIHRVPAVGGETDSLMPTPVLSAWIMDWSPDGEHLLYLSGAGADLEVLPLSGDRKPIPFAATRFRESQGRFSPDGRWIAYTSNQSGRPEVYVDTFPARTAPRPISSGGGTQPMWRRDGRELFFLGLDGTLTAAAIRTAPSFEVAGLTPLFRAPLRSRFANVRNDYVVSPDGQRFLMVIPDAETAGSSFTVAVNWTAGLAR